MRVTPSTCAQGPSSCVRKRGRGRGPQGNGTVPTPESVSPRERFPYWPSTGAVLILKGKVPLPHHRVTGVRRGVRVEVFRYSICETGWNGIGGNRWQWVAPLGGGRVKRTAFKSKEKRHMAQ